MTIRASGDRDTFSKSSLTRIDRVGDAKYETRQPDPQQRIGFTVATKCRQNRKISFSNTMFPWIWYLTHAAKLKNESTLLVQKRRCDCLIHSLRGIKLKQFSTSNYAVVRPAKSPQLFMLMAWRLKHIPTKFAYLWNSEIQRSHRRQRKDSEAVDCRTEAHSVHNKLRSKRILGIFLKSPSECLKEFCHGQNKHSLIATLDLTS